MRNLVLQDGSRLYSDGLGAKVVAKDGSELHLDQHIWEQYGFNDFSAAVFFQRELEYIKSESYDVQYPELKARYLFPVSNSAGPGRTSITYRSYDRAGKSALINSHGDDIPRVDVSATETTKKIHQMAASFGISKKELACAQRAGLPLDVQKANAVRSAIEEQINYIAFNGYDSANITGLFNDPYVTEQTVVDYGPGTEWINKTPDQILLDINDAFSEVTESTLGVEMPNTLVLPLQQYNYIDATPRASNSDTSILQYVVNNSRFIRSRDDIQWANECAGANNDVYAEDVMFVYNRNPRKLQLEIPVELEYEPAQYNNLEFTVIGLSETAGLNIYYPLSVLIAKGI